MLANQVMFSWRENEQQLHNQMEHSKCAPQLPPYNMNLFICQAEFCVCVCVNATCNFCNGACKRAPLHMNVCYRAIVRSWTAPSTRLYVCYSSFALRMLVCKILLNENRCCTCTCTLQHDIDRLIHNESASQPMNASLFQPVCNDSLAVCFVHKHTRKPHKAHSPNVWFSRDRLFERVSIRLSMWIHTYDACNFRIDCVTSPNDLCACHTNPRVMWLLLLLCCSLYLAQRKLCPFGIHSSWR